MLYGLFLFLFRLKSRRDFNDKLTAHSIQQTLSQFFPELNSIPHADTISRILSRIDIGEIERIHIQMIKDLIKKKKFSKLFIAGCIPISIDGTQKAKRDGELEEGGWLIRTIHTASGEERQQYVFVVEANMTLSNGLTIPLLTEYCQLEPADKADEVLKQDCELKAFARLVDKLKKYFPRQHLMIILDNLYACEQVLSKLKQNRWEFMIKLPAKVSTLYNALKAEEETKQSIPDKPRYRCREQYFYWLNDCDYRGMNVHLVACQEQWDAVNNETGERLRMRSEHTWISSIPLSIDNVHELCNLGARNRALIEESFNTEKNRGYHYKHLFSHDWQAMKGFHYLMRLAHAINAISSFGKLLRQHIRSFGVANTLTRIYEAIKHHRLSDEWATEEKMLTPQLRLDL